MNGLLRQLCSRQFAVFVSVGVVCAIVDVGTLQSLVWGGSDPLAAATAGFFCALLLNFVLHLRVTFAATWSRRAVWRYLLIVALHYGVTLGFVAASDELGLGPLPGKLVSLPLIAANGFLLCRHWVFR